MDYFGYAYFVERPRRIEDLTVPHLVEKERPYRIVTEIQLPAIDYETVSSFRTRAAAVKRARSGTACSSAAEANPMASWSCRKATATSAGQRLKSYNLFLVIAFSCLS